MKNIDDKSIDLIICDLPYEVTNRSWDVIIPFAPLWGQYERIIKDNGAMIFTATEPFRTKLISSNFDLFKYDLIWEKNKSTGFLNSKKQPLRSHESILVFYKKPPTYNPQKTTGHKPMNACVRKSRGAETYGAVKELVNTGGRTDRFPRSVIKIPVVNNDSKEKIHSSQKPVELMEYLIKSYSNENDVVLDNCAGSGSTLIAAKNLNRRWIGIEKDDTIYNLTKAKLGL
jgi:site-specific DNA-methyltransferase (adenine-specific)